MALNLFNIETIIGTFKVYTTRVDMFTEVSISQERFNDLLGVGAFPSESTAFDRLLQELDGEIGVSTGRREDAVNEDYIQTQCAAGSKAPIADKLHQQI